MNSFEYTQQIYMNRHLHYCRGWGYNIYRGDRLVSRGEEGYLQIDLDIWVNSDGWRPWIPIQR